MNAPLLYWEDIAVGQVLELGARKIELEEILAFAHQYDPQLFHVDEEAARQSIYGGIIASGWQTAAIAQRMLIDGFLGRAVSLGSPGVEELRWRKPVRPGDELSLRLEVVDKQPSPKHGDRGSIDVVHEIKNQRGELVMSYRARVMIGRRAARAL
jgi:acyl dehydratase